jgi:phenylpropionate dioxygenase-like ring-hydroxylating dioxygenase large terminal subunit
VFVAFAPIDEGNTMLYVRFYQRFLRVPLLDKLFCQLSNLGYRIIVRQDKRVVITQQPKKTALAMGEKLFQADGPIVAYRQRRQHLIDAPKPRDQAGRAS